MHIMDEGDISFSEPDGHFGGLTTGNVVSWDQGEKYAIQLSVTPPGGGGYSHYHADMDQIFYILSGQYEFSNGEQTTVLTSGQSVLFKAGEYHASINKTDSEVRCLVITVTT